MFAERTERPFESKVVLLSILILNEVVILLVDRVIGQVHKLIVLVNLRRVRLTSKASESFLEDVHSERLIAGNQHVQSQIKLVSINQ